MRIYPCHCNKIYRAKSVQCTNRSPPIIRHKNLYGNSSIQIVKSGSITATDETWHESKTMKASQFQKECSGGSKGGGVRDTLPWGPNSFNFMQFLGKFGKIICWRPPGSWRPLIGEILDLSLECNIDSCSFTYVSVIYL